MSIRSLTHRVRPFVSLSFVCVAATAQAQDPIIGPQVRIDLGGGVFAANETTAASSEFNPMVVIGGWNDWRAGGDPPIFAGFSISFNGGTTWADMLVRPPAPNQSTVEGDPMTAFDDRTGSLWAGAISFAGNGGLYVARLDPGDTTFDPSVMADLGGGIDKCWMAAGQRLNLPLTTRLFIAYNLGIIWSDSMGNAGSWTNPISLGSGLGFLPRVGPNGEIYVAYWNGSTQMKMRRSLNDGVSFTDHVIANRLDTWGTQDGSRFPGNFRVPSMVYLDVNPTNGHLYACYFDTTNIIGGNRNVDLYFTKSTNQGTSWSAPVVIPSDTNPGGDQFFPWIECDETGRIHILFFDSSRTIQNDSTSNVNGFFDAEYVYSDDAGATWHEYRLSPVSWNSFNDGLNRTQQFIGDYNGMAVAGNRVYPVYLDTHTGDPNIYTNVIVFPDDQATLTNVTMITGTNTGGNLASLVSDDGDRYRTRSGFGNSLTTLHMMRMEIGANTPNLTPTSLDIDIDSRTNQSSGTATVYLRNYDTNSFNQVAQYAVDNTEDTQSIHLNGGGQWVDGDGDMLLAIRHTVVTPIFVFQFDSFFDMVRIIVND